MRIPIVILAASLLAASLLAACVSGTRVVYVPVPASDPVPPPPAPMPPVAVTIARVEDSRVLVSTNQAAYLAVFEIVPGRGVTLAYPTSPRQRRQALAGSNWLTVSRWSERDDRYDRVARSERAGFSERHLYVIASERPLRLNDDAFDDDYLRNAVVGPRASRAPGPYETMAALSRRFVPPERDEDWGEDLYTIAVARPTVVVRVAKIYCPDGSVIYVRDEMAERITCPYRGRRDGPENAPPPRPDSVVASNGRPIIVRPSGPPMQPPIFRVPRPADDNPMVEQQGGRRVPPGHPVYPDNRMMSADSSGDERSAKRRPGKEHEDTDHRDGADRGNHNKPDRPGDAENNQRGGNNGNNDDKGRRRIGPWGIPIPAPPEKPEQPTQVAPPPAQKPEQKPPKAEERPEQKPEHKHDDNDESKGKSEEREKRERAKVGTSDTTSTSAPADSSDAKRRKAKPKSSDPQ